MPAEAIDEHYYKRVMEMGDATYVLEEADVKVAEAEQKTQEDKQQKTQVVRTGVQGQDGHDAKTSSEQG